ncbi:hypothetical protein ABIB25_004943 [Nakamurella sp. UYEF19]|uniref:M28 family peptidase n=1 Tax=Nakamurella sp. UYEF19 TaxID=1756392 RepID=UPI003394872F
MKAEPVDQSVVDLVRDLDIDQDYLRRVITTLTGIGSSPIGFRNTGTAEDLAVAEFVSAEMRAIGLVDVAREPVEVDAWRFLSASVEAHLPGNEPKTVTYEAVSFGGMAPTPDGGISGLVVDIADGRRRVLDRCDLRASVVLLDWRRPAIHPSAVVLELSRRGVAGIILNCPAKGPWYQTTNALGGFDSHWPAGVPPMVLITKEDAAALRDAMAAGSIHATITLNAEVTARAEGHNVVGYLPGTLPGPIVVGAHHDAWFQGAFDNSSGVAVMLALAKALVAGGQEPRHTICFSSRTAEEYGIIDSLFDWCIGAWGQVNTTHPQWAIESPFHLCVEASGHAGLRSVIEAPAELAPWARRVGRAAAAQGWAPTGWRVAPPVAGTEQWPFLIAGVPGVACYAWEKSFARSDYHTQFDTIELLDFEILAAQTRLYALLLLSADADPDGILDHTARARQLAAIADHHEHTDLQAAAEQHMDAKGRRDFTRIGSSQFALDASSSACYPHQQSQRDLAAITSAISAYETADRTAAARAVQWVGHHELFPYLGPEAFATHLARHEPPAVTRTWASASHLTPVVNLWAELATLTGQPGARPDGPWLIASLRQAWDDTQLQLTERLDAMARSVTPRHSVNRGRT